MEFEPDDADDIGEGLRPSYAQEFSMEVLGSQGGLKVRRRAQGMYSESTSYNGRAFKVAMPRTEAKY